MIADGGFNVTAYIDIFVNVLAIFAVPLGSAYCVSQTFKLQIRNTLSTFSGVKKSSNHRDNCCLDISRSEAIFDRTKPSSGL